MKDKFSLFKFLRLIFYALAIISMVFALYKKISKAAAAQTIYTEPPYPVGDGYGYYPYQEEMFQQAVSEILAFRPDVQLIYCTQFTDSNYAYFNGVYNLTDISITGALNSGFSRANYQGSMVDGFIWSNGSIVQYTYQAGSPNYCQLSNYTEFDVNNPNFVWLMRNVYIPGYPLYISPNVNKSVYEDSFFVKSGSGGIGLTGGASGSITSPGGDSSSLDLEFDLILDDSAFLDKLQEILDSNLSQEDKLDSIIQLLSSSNGKYDSIIGYLQSNNNALSVLSQKLDLIYGKLVDSQDGNKSWLEKIYLKLVQIYDYITEPYNSQEIEEKLSSLQIGQDMQSFRNSISQVSGVFDAPVATSSELRFEIPFTLPYINYSDSVVIDFSFYESIRNIIMPFIVAFLCFGFVLSLVRSIPGIFHGNAPDNES